VGKIERGLKNFALTILQILNDPKILKNSFSYNTIKMLHPLNTETVKKEKLKQEKNYENYKWFFTSEGKLAVGGKNEEQNELVIKYFLKPEYKIMHTRKPGSPFMIIKDEKPSKKDVDETAIFTACFSKQWKQGRNLIEVDIFKGSQVYKSKRMKKGTFGVMGSKKTIKVKPELVLVMQKGKLRAVPKPTKEKKLVKITPGNLSKEKASEKIAKIIKDKYSLPITKQEIMQAIPSGSIGVG
jgi:predicted ribosome quality control (RQC) complex YloA/Tae2 family protein